MAGECVLDAHALIWFLEGNPRLGTAAKAVLQGSTNLLYLPVIALAEACWLVERGRSTVPSVVTLLGEVDHDRRVAVVPLDRAILDRSLMLTAIGEMHDRQIIATALHLAGQTSGIPVLTADRVITASGIVPVVW